MGVLKVWFQVQVVQQRVAAAASWAISQKKTKGGDAVVGKWCFVEGYLRGHDTQRSFLPLLVGLSKLQVLSTRNPVPLDDFNGLGVKSGLVALGLTSAGLSRFNDSWGLFW